MKFSELARLRGIYQRLTPAQRAQLMAIVQCDNQPLTLSVCVSLVALELVRLDGEKYLATEHGRFVASLH